MLCQAGTGRASKQLGDFKEHIRNEWNHKKKSKRFRSVFLFYFEKQSINTVCKHAKLLSALAEEVISLEFIFTPQLIWVSSNCYLWVSMQASGCRFHSEWNLQRSVGVRLLVYRFFMNAQNLDWILKCFHLFLRICSLKVFHAWCAIRVFSVFAEIYVDYSRFPLASPFISLSRSFLCYFGLDTHRTGCFALISSVAIDSIKSIFITSASFLLHSTWTVEVFSVSLSETENREKETCATINVSNAETHTNIK